jgi:hypothetical protein
MQHGYLLGRVEVFEKGLFVWIHAGLLTPFDAA